MVRDESSPGSPRLASFLALFLPPAVTAAVAAVAVSVVTAAARVPVAWCGLVATAAVTVVAAEAARRGRTTAAMRQRQVELETEFERRLTQQRAQTVWLAEELLPAAVARLQRGETPSEVLAGAADAAGPDAEFQAAHLAVLRSVLDAVGAEEDLRDSAQRAFVNIARRVQAIVHQQAQALREMEDRHGRNPHVFGDLLHLDHGTALIGRLADSIAVLGGARPGRQWSRAVPLFSVLRGAMSRILDYRRVELHSVSEVAIVGPAVEPLIHAIAELLDNATRYSPPQTRVHLTAVEVQSGIAVEIEDGGVSLSEEGRLRAERVLKQAQAGIDLNDLGETPRLGLAVVGRLAQAYNLQVSLRPSAYGGVRAVLIIPQELVTTAPATGRAHGIGAAAGARPDTVPEASVPQRSRPGPRQSALAPTDDEAPVVTDRTAMGLPQRRRRAPAPADRTGPAPATADLRSTASATADPAPDESPVQPGMWLAAFQSGVSGDPQPADPASRSSDESSDKGE